MSKERRLLALRVEMVEDALREVDDHLEAGRIPTEMIDHLFSANLHYCSFYKHTKGREKWKRIARMTIALLALISGRTP